MKTSSEAAQQALEAMFALRALVLDDALACTYQTLGQYRTALKQQIDRAIVAQREGANCHPPALLRTARHLLEAVDAALPQAPHCGEFDALADAAADLTAALAEAQAWAAAGQPAKPAQTPAGTTTRLTSDRVAVVDEAVEWRPMSYCPPRRKVLLLTDGGVAVLGTWDGVSTWAIAWAPLPVIPAWLRERLAPVAVRLEQDITLGGDRHEI